jgi:opacity protein-like surface antigen
MRVLMPAVRTSILFLMVLAGVAGQASAFGDNAYVEKPWTFQIGAGYTPVVGGMDSQLTGGWNFGVGTAYNFTESLGLLLEYGSHHGGIENGILGRYSALIADSTDGYTRIWSLTLNPRWSFKMNQMIGGYVIGGGGYYHANAQITTPSVAFVPGYCDPWWGCWPGGIVPADRIIAERKDDTGGINLGLGLTFDVTSGVQLYVESRYHYILIHGPDIQLLPVTAGFRF